MGSRSNTKKFIQIAAIFLALQALSMNVLANPDYPINDDDTILVDQQPSTKIPYSKIVRAVIHKIFSVDSERVMTFGGNGDTSIARSFNDYVDRTRTRVKVKEDEVEFELKLNF